MRSSEPSGAWAVATENVGYAYGDRAALKGVTLSVAQGEVFGLLGENGGGKTTLFKILSTLMPPDGGRATVLGHDLATEARRIRERLGVVFQRPSLDPKLTVFENLMYQGRLYGLHGRRLKERARDALSRLGVEDRSRDRVETLSGGLQRRTELAKVLLHRPRLLLLDEPGTGLDPGARKSFGDYLQELREAEGVTVLLTTHILEEAERCDRVACLHRGEVVAVGTPDELKARVGGDVVVMQPHDAEDLAAALRARFGCEVQRVGGALRVEREKGHEFVRDVVEAFPGAVRSITFGKPTLEDVFVHLTGRGIYEEPAVEGEGRP